MEKEYIEECINRYQDGGTLWLIERTDTNMFCYKEIKFRYTNKPETWCDSYLWSKDIHFFTCFFLTKEDAENEIKHMNLTEGGCSCCGHGSKQIPVIITEHEFL